MCGIVGQVSWSDRSDHDVTKKMCEALTHRGPDNHGYHFSAEVSFGHRRLSIIDLSEAAVQPMNRDEFFLTYNGEIYNFQALRAELQELGHRFATESDTEVVLASYQEWQEGCVQKFNGMFAFAIWDEKKKQVFMARDRLGKKPFFYHFRAGFLAFASELKSLLKVPQLSKVINSQAVGQYLRLGYTLTDQCIVEGIEKLPPAHYAIINANGIQKACYWNIAEHFHNKSQDDFETASERVRELVDDSVKLRMISDVPLGLFLSGGVDSATLAASMANAVPPDQVKSYSIGFFERSYSEVDEAQFTANHLKIDHSDKFVDITLTDALQDIVYHADEPYSDTSMIPTYYLCRYARDKVTVALTGDGGDEIFAGYETYLADYYYQNIVRHLPPSVLSGVRRAAHLLPSSHKKVSFDYKLKKFLSLGQANVQRAHYFWRTLFDEHELQDILVSDVWEQIRSIDPYHSFDKFFQQVSDCHYIDQGLYVDLKTWLADDILVKADRMSMAHSLELRSPLLDYRLVEYAASLPVDYKFRRQQKKYVLKKSQTGRLPDSVLYRKKKGFNAPVSVWFSAELGELLTSNLQSDEARSFFDPKGVLKLLKNHREKKQDNGFKLFTILNFIIWLKTFSNR